MYSKETRTQIQDLIKSKIQCLWSVTLHSRGATSMVFSRLSYQSVWLKQKKNKKNTCRMHLADFDLMNTNFGFSPYKL